MMFAPSLLPKHIKPMFARTKICKWVDAKVTGLKSNECRDNRQKCLTFEIGYSTNSSETSQTPQKTEASAMMQPNKI